MTTYKWRPLQCPKCEKNAFEIHVIDYTDIETSDSDPQDIMCKCLGCDYEFIATYSS